MNQNITVDSIAMKTNSKFLWVSTRKGLTLSREYSGVVHYNTEHHNAAE
jgi:hypothetical protein